MCRDISWWVVLVCFSGPLLLKCFGTLMNKCSMSVQQQQLCSWKTDSLSLHAEKRQSSVLNQSVEEAQQWKAAGGGKSDSVNSPLALTPSLTLCLLE